MGSPREFVLSTNQGDEFWRKELPSGTLMIVRAKGQEGQEGGTACANSKMKHGVPMSAVDGLFDVLPLLFLFPPAGRRRAPAEAGRLLPLLLLLFVRFLPGGADGRLLLFFLLPVLLKHYVLANVPVQ